MLVFQPLATSIYKDAFRMDWTQVKRNANLSADEPTGY